MNQHSKLTSNAEPNQASQADGVKNPKRVAAGQRNRALRGELSAAGRAKLRQTALMYQPWKHATGPRTTAGKRRTALNGKSRQKGLISFRELRRLLGESRALVRAMRALRAQVTSEGGTI